METIDTWIKKQESDSLFSLREGESPLLKFVEVGKANRINTVQQAQLLTRMRCIADYMSWAWLQGFCDYVEDYQVTAGWPHNSREMLLEAIQFERHIAAQRGKTSVNLITGNKELK